MDTLYHQTNKLIQQTQQTFQILEQSPGNACDIEADIQDKINAINSNCEKLDVYLYKVPFDQNVDSTRW